LHQLLLKNSATPQVWFSKILVWLPERNLQNLFGIRNMNVRCSPWQYPGRRLVTLVVLCLFAVACSSDSALRPFTSDGCSLFPDSSLISENDWCSCCFDHDLRYWRGGTREEREIADAELRDCVLEKTESSALSEAMYEGVRVGGSPYFYNWYRWGYGWSFDRKYQLLTPDEIEGADKLVEKYYAETDNPVCPI